MENKDNDQRLLQKQILNLKMIAVAFHNFDY